MVHQVSVGSMNHHTSQLRQAARMYDEDSAILMQGGGAPSSAINRTPGDQMLRFTNAANMDNDNLRDDDQDFNKFMRQIDGEFSDLDSNDDD